MYWREAQAGFLSLIERRFVHAGLLVAAISLFGCTPKTVVDRQSLMLLMPEKIAVMPFTRVESFDNDDRPDGVALLVRPINVLGDPVNIVGDVRAELFEFVQASGDPKGDRIAMWNIALSSKRDQLKHWSSTTQMYEFRLEFDTDVVPKHRKYVLEVTYNTPLGTHLTDEYILELPIARESFAGAQAPSES